MKLLWIVSALTTIVVGLPLTALADDFSNKLVGTYSCKETNFVTVKRLSFTKEKDGSIKIRGALVGFPAEVSIGEATAELYADRNNKSDPRVILASFSSDKYKPLLVIQPGGWTENHVDSLVFTCYMKDVDGAKVQFNGTLRRDP